MSIHHVEDVMDVVDVYLIPRCDTYKYTYNYSILIIESMLYLDILTVEERVLEDSLWRRAVLRIRLSHRLDVLPERPRDPIPKRTENLRVRVRVRARTVGLWGLGLGWCGRS